MFSSGKIILIIRLCVFGAHVLKKRRFDIFNTFELFNMEALNVIKERIIKFVLIEADNLSGKKSDITADLAKDDTVQLTVFNNLGLYTLLDSTWRKRQQKLKDENIKR